MNSKNMNNNNELKTKEITIDLNKNTDDSLPVIKPIKSMRNSNSTFRVLRFGSVMQTWTDVSKINYMSALTFEELPKALLKRLLEPTTSVEYLSNREEPARNLVVTLLRTQFFSIVEYEKTRLQSLGMIPKNCVNLDFESYTIDNRNDSKLSECFFVNVTSLLNEDQLWGCFYNFPHLYDDAYSPIVRIRNLEDVPDPEAGILTRDMVTACLSYLKRTPILGDYVYIKLDLASKCLVNIDILQHYKYIVYLNLSSNLITDLKVLSNLLYLQYLCVSYNRLKTVLDYETPQWFLTEVHYRYNSVLTIRDLSALWSITVLDLSHNNIKEISGLQNLRYLRHLDLSFNHIQRLENLNHLRLLWLDVSYNNISSFEFGLDAGIWTLLHLEYLNLNENNLTSMKIFSGCTRLRELHAKNNRLSILMELALYMRKLRRLMLMDLRSNPVCIVPGYKDVVINTFPMLLNLDDKDLDPVEKRTSMMLMAPNLTAFASRRLLRLLYIQQLSRSRISPYTPPADTTDVPIIVLVGYEAVGKGSLARRLAAECSSKIELGVQHTTAFYHYANHYKVITRRNFDDILLAGDFLTYSELDGESYGLSREEAFVKDGKVRLVTMDLLGALMLKMRGYRPYLIFANYLDKKVLSHRQHEREIARTLAHEKKSSMEPPRELSTLQVILSGRIIINGILNEILQLLSDGKQRSEFVLDSECSLMMDSEIRRNEDFKCIDRVAMSISSSTLFENKVDLNKSSCVDSGLHSLYKELPGTDMSDVCGLTSYQERNQTRKSNDVRSAQNKQDKTNIPGRKSIDFSKSSTGKGFSTLPDSRKSSKSVTFTSPENTVFVEQVPSTSGMMIDPRPEKEMENLLMKSISAKVAWPHADARPQDSDLWLAFLIENGLLENSETSEPCQEDRRKNTSDDPDFIVNQLDHYKELPSESFTTNIRDNYEEVHRNSPGLFYDTVTMDNPEASFNKMKALIKNIINSEQSLKPRIDIDFANTKHCRIANEKLTDIRRQITPQRLFY